MCTPLVNYVNQLTLPFIYLYALNPTLPQYAIIVDTSYNLLDLSFLTHHLSLSKKDLNYHDIFMRIPVVEVLICFHLAINADIFMYYLLTLQISPGKIACPQSTDITC